jgi:hypothetical protein
VNIVHNPAMVDLQNLAIEAPGLMVEIPAVTSQASISFPSDGGATFLELDRARLLLELLFLGSNCRNCQ